MIACKECGQSFKRNRKEQLFCNRTCANIYRARERERAKEKHYRHTVWSCGGGVQSIAIAALIVRGEIPKPDLALMTDCSYEPTYVMSYLRQYVMPDLESVGVKLNIVDSTKYVDVGLFDNGYLAIPAYIKKGNEVTKLRTFCSRRFKVRPAMNWIREQGVKRCENWIGISLEESRRAKPSTRKWISYRYPLVDLMIDREDCFWIIGKQGWPRPERSSCVMCPQQTESEWERIKRLYPYDYRRAQLIEQEMQQIMPDVYLKRSLRPL